MKGIAGALLAALGLVGAAGCSTTSSIDGPVRVAPQRDWTDAVVYFVIVDRFADGDSRNNDGVDRSNPGGWHGGDLRGLTANLDEIAGLGATAIWITPVVRQIDFAPFAQAPPETGIGDFEHHGFHGYWADDYLTLDAHFGSEAELAALVDAAHARGLKVLLDVVYNHVGYGASYLADPETRDWVRTRPVDCAADAVLCQVGGLPDLRTERDDVREHLFEAHLGLAQRTGLDGFRLDTVKHVEHDFWREHRRRARAIDPDFFLLGEVWGGDYRVLDEWFEHDEMDAGFDFGFSGSCLSFVEGKGRTVAYSAYLEKRHRVRDGYHLAHYLSSHDETMAYYRLGFDEEKFRLCVALQMTSFGIPVIYYGEEVGRRGGVWPTNRKDMPWGQRRTLPGRGVARDEDLREYYRRLIAVRRSHTALTVGDYTRLSTEGDLLVFGREDAANADAVVVAVNRGDEAASTEVELPSAWRGRLVREALGGAEAKVAGERLVVEVPPRTARIYEAG